jgi:hypothetical protein
MIMKKQILSLMLSASILTASPLFAMDDSNDPNETLHKAAIKQTAPIHGLDPNELQVLEQLYLSRCIKTFKHSSGDVTYANIISSECNRISEMRDKAYKNKGKPFEKPKYTE